MRRYLHTQALNQIVVIMVSNKCILIKSILNSNKAELIYMISLGCNSKVWYNEHSKDTAIPIHQKKKKR